MTDSACCSTGAASDKPTLMASGDPATICQLIFVSASQLMLPNTTASLAATSFHHVLRCHRWASLHTSNITVFVTAVLFLACKATENLRSMRDIYNVVSIQRHPSLSLEEMGKGYCLRKESIIASEHRILRLVQFELNDDFPYKYLLNIARYLRLRQGVVHIAWMLMNDSFKSDMVISTPPAVHACACLFCALELGKASGSRAAPSVGSLEWRWWTIFEVEDDQLVGACDWIIRIWEENASSPSVSPSISTLEVANTATVSEAQPPL